MDPVGILVVAGLFGGFFAWAVRADRRRKRQQPDSPVVTVREARPGQFVRIVGSVVEGTTIVAPISGRACVCYSAAAIGIELVYSKKGQAEPTRRWHSLVERVGANPFVLEDRTGRIAVDPRGAVIRLELDHHVVVKRGSSLPVHEPGFVTTDRELDEIVLDEGVVPNGARVVVEAMVQVKGAGPDGDAYRGASGELYLAGGASRSPSISDLPANIEQALASAT